MKIEGEKGGEEYEMEEEVSADQPLTGGTSSSPKVKVTSPDGKNGDAKISIRNGVGGNVGMSKQELMKYANDPFWVRLRMFLFILFWVVWFAMLIGAVVIIILAPKCSPAASLKWWQKASYNEITLPQLGRTPEDIELQAKKIASSGIKSIIITPYAKHHSGFGYEVTNHTEIDSSFGTIKEFDEFRGKLAEKGVSIVLRFIGDYTSVNHPWFNASIHRDPYYDDFYVWHDGDNKSTVIQGRRGVPNTWRNSFGNGTAWKWNDVRKQYYLHQFNEDQPDLNLRSEGVKKELKKVFLFWIKRKVDGFLFDQVAYLVEDDKIDYLPTTANQTKNRPENLEVIQDWRKSIAKASYNKVILSESYDFDSTPNLYGSYADPLIDLPLNNLFIEFNDKTKLVMNRAEELTKQITNWLTLIANLNWPVDAKPPAPWTAWHLDHKKTENNILNIIALTLPKSSPFFRTDESKLIPLNDLLDLRQANPESLLLGETLFPNNTQRNVFVMTRVHKPHNGYVIAANFEALGKTINLKESYLPSDGKIVVTDTSSNPPRSNARVGERVNFADFTLDGNQVVVIEFKPPE